MTSAAPPSVTMRRAISAITFCASGLISITECSGATADRSGSTLGARPKARRRAPSRPTTLSPIPPRSSRTGAPAARRKIRWRRGRAVRLAFPSGCCAIEWGASPAPASRAEPAAAPGWSRSDRPPAARSGPARRGAPASTSAIKVPRPGPSSTSRAGCGAPASAQASASQRPIISPNIWLISGAVMKSPCGPKGSCVM